MKKIFIILILGVSMLASCTDDDPQPSANYSMPLITGNMIDLKNHLLTITPVVTETQDGNVFTFVCKPASSNTNMFSELVYVYSFKGLELDEFTFSYKIHSSVTQADEARLTDFLKNTIVSL